MHINYICALNGVTAPRIDKPFTYCELGCGAGETSNLLAAANPHGQFLGIDLDPAQIEYAKSVSRRAHIDNVQFRAADIVSIDHDSLPEFDYITMHGLYSWVPPNVQRAIEEFLTAKLKPGGLAYISYNALPGWSAVAPLRDAFVARASQSGQSTLDAARSALQELQALAEAEAPFFKENPVAAHILAKLSCADIRYVAHEYLAAHWQPLYFREMHRRMSAAGFHFVGDGAIIENVLEHSVPEQFVEPLKQLPNREQLESQRDFIQNRFFRRDVYIKSNGLVEQEPDELLKDCLFGFTTSPTQVPSSIRVMGDTKLTFDGAWFERVKQLLAFRVLTGREICSDPMLANISDAELIGGLRTLSIGGFFAPFAQQETRPAKDAADVIAIVPPLNADRVDDETLSAGGLSLACPVTGSAIALESLEVILLAGLRNTDPLPWIEAEIDRRSLSIRSQSDGEPVKDPVKRREVLTTALDTFCRVRLPKLAYLGIVTQG